MKDFKRTSIKLCIFPILINFTMEIVSINIMQLYTMYFNRFKFLFAEKLSKWTCVCKILS